MKGDEQRVEDAFCKWLVERGWQVQRQVEYVDVLAVRANERLYAEVKGRTSSPGLDVDTLYGQLLRRMPDELPSETRFAVVVPEETARAALRVPARVRSLLRIDLYAVSAEGQVRLVAAA